MPLLLFLFGLFINMLSIKVADLSVILVGFVIEGKNDYAYIRFIKSFIKTSSLNFNISRL